VNETLFTHASLSRPRMVPMTEGLPAGAQVQRRYTPWQEIMETLVKYEGTWFELTRRYTSLGSAISSARKVLDADYDKSIAERLESASLAESEFVVRVFLRIAPAEAEEGVVE
jgi:DNA repair ATPase RecN